MILFFNVFVTTKAFTIYDRGELGPSEDRLDVFKYTLASFEPLKWEHVVIYAELDEMYAHRNVELESYIRSLFPNVIFFPYRNKHQRDWKVAMEKLFALPSDGLVWFSCNDDHIFIDYETALFERLHLAALKELESHPHVSIFPFSWAERICYSAAGYVGHEEPCAYPVHERTNDYFKISWGHNDSAQVVSKEVLRKWWFDFDYGDAFKPRTDTGPAPEPGVPDIHTFMPWRELSLHYDGSSHVGMDINAYPAHKIPEGFFENDIKIQFGGASRLPGYVWLNPDIEKHRTVAEDGVDYRFVIDDLPLFWRTRISEVKICEDRDEEFWIRRRNDAVLRTASQFWPNTKEELVQNLGSVFRPLPSGAFPLSEQTENLGRFRYCTIYKSECRRTKFAYLLLERYVAQTAFQAVHSIQAGMNSPSDSQIVWIGTQPRFDRAMFSLVSKCLVANDPELFELASYNKHRAWNIAASQADADTLVFTDTLNIFPSDFEVKVNAILSDHDAVTIGSRYLTFGPYSASGSMEPAALVVKRSSFKKFNEDPVQIGEYGGLDRCSAYLSSLGLRIVAAPTNIFCWRVPAPRNLLLEGARPPIEIGQRYQAQNPSSRIFLEGINRAILRSDTTSALRLARKIPQFPGLRFAIEVLLNLGKPASAIDSLSLILEAFGCSGQHLAFAAAVLKSIGDESGALRLAQQALSLEPCLTSPQLIRLYDRLKRQDSQAQGDCLHLIRMSPLEESLWGMIGL